MTVPANSRRNIWPAAGLPEFALLQGRRFAVFLESVGGEHFVAERAMYWNDFIGGHANAGTPWTGVFGRPPSLPPTCRSPG